MEPASRLRGRQPEIEQALLARMSAVSDPAEVEAPEYIAGLQQAMTSAIEYGLDAIEGVDTQSRPIPTPLLTQVRAAARFGIGVDVVLRRYFAGYSLFTDFIICETKREGGIDPRSLHRALRVLAAVFDHLVAVIAEEHGRTLEEGRGTSEHRRARCVKQVLAGEVAEALDLDYKLDSRWHLGAVGSGPGSPQAFRDLARSLDRHLLLVRPYEDTLWAWFGGRKRVTAEEAVGVASECWPAGAVLALGEPATGIMGWRLSHRQASASMSVALRESMRVVRYADVALLASVLQDDTLASSLRAIYLEPLAKEGDGGEASRRTLRAYFATSRHVSSTAAALGVSRQTVNSRLRRIEAKLGRPLDSCAAELEVALRFLELSQRQVR
jgi:hypothetical protein